MKTLKARLTLDDCRTAYFELESAEEKNDIQLIRLRWITCITLLRTVGHVLHKVDAEQFLQNPIFKKMHNLHKNDSVFRDFIESERNLVLKEYETGLRMDHRIEKRSDLLVTEGGDYIVTESGDRIALQSETQTPVFVSKNSFVFEEITPSKQISICIDWWEKYLASLEKILGDENSKAE